LHTNSLDETYALPTEDAVTIALRTQQILAEESGVAATIDPLGGSYFVEDLTNRIEREAMQYICRIDEMGGMVSAVEKGYPQREIASSAYRFQREIERDERVMVGVNKYAKAGLTSDAGVPLLRVDDDVQRTQVENLRRVKAARDASRVQNALEGVRAAARRTPGTPDSNLMPPIIDAAKAYCTQQEICDVLRDVLGTYSDPAEF
jgi:methylmalonyl-CoA mutase N-terminal domain/subunit